MQVYTEYKYSRGTQIPTKNIKIFKRRNLMVLRKLCSLLLCLTLMLGMSIPVCAAAEQTVTVDPINIMVGGKTFLPTDANGDNVPVFAYNGTTYAPLRALAEAYGLSVGYNAEKNLATVDGTPDGSFSGTKGTAPMLTERTELSVVPINIAVNGAVFEPKDALGRPVSVFAYNGTTYAPLRALAEAYGLVVGYDSEKNLATVTFPAAAVLSEEKDAELHAELQSRIDEILNTETEIVHSDTFIPGKTYTGTAYYVSNDGDDENDGLTPETAWRTVGRMNQELDRCEGSVMKPGDAIFLRRGDTFRLSDWSWSLNVSLDEVTISAYGEGDKPILTASSENGIGEDKWQLVYEDDTGKKIWQYYLDMRDISRIVLNDGEAIAERVYEYYDGTGYVSCEATGWWMHDAEGVTLLDKLLPLEESMTEDLTIISRPQRYHADAAYIDGGMGPLYLRCDAGNPGVLYDSVEFSEYYVCGIVWLSASDVVFDNISFRCGGNSYMKSAMGWKGLRNTVIRNCEFAYGGCTVTYYHERDDGAIVVEVQGDGIYSIVENTTIENCYFHDMASSTSTYEADINDTESVDSYFHFLNNVVVNTNGIRLDSTSESLQYLSSVKVCGNYVWNTGHMDQGKLIYSEGSLFLAPNYYGECIIEDNVFYGTENGYESNALLNVWFYEDQGNTVPQIRSNTYVQYADRKFGYFTMYDEWDWYMNDPNLRIKAAELLGDTTSEFYIIQ